MELSEVAQNAIDAAARGGFFALIALGVAMLFGIMNLINFAYGELIMAGGYAMLVFTDWFFDATVWPLLIIWTGCAGSTPASAVPRSPTSTMSA